jgi:hypothetical protein
MQGRGGGRVPPLNTTGIIKTPPTITIQTPSNLCITGNLYDKDLESLQLLYVHKVPESF